MTERIFPQNNDVVWMEQRNSPSGCATTTIKDMRGAIGNKTEVTDNWFFHGVNCQLLSTSGGGWVKGRLRFVLEFIPYGTPDKDKQPEDKPVIEPESPLRDLREQLDL